MAISALKKLEKTNFSNQSEESFFRTSKDTANIKLAQNLHTENDRDSIQIETQADQQLEDFSLYKSLTSYTKQKIQEDLARIARLGANISDAHSCFIFLSSNLFNDTENKHRKNEITPLRLIAHHTLSTKINHSMELHSQTGFLGWALRNNRVLHISPFERDSRSIDIYRKNENLKSLLAIPFAVSESNNDTQNFKHQGMLVCDSKKSFSFSKLQQKILSDLTLEISNLTSLHIDGNEKNESKTQDWENFYSESLRLLDQVGVNSLKLMRVTFSNYDHLKFGSSLESFIDRSSGLFKLISQAIPQAFPRIKLPNGELLFLVDTMFSDILISRITAILEDEKNKRGKVHTNAKIENKNSLRFYSKRLKQRFFSQKSFSTILEEAWSSTQKTKSLEKEIRI